MDRNINDIYSQVHDLCLRIGFAEDVVRLVLENIADGTYLLAEPYLNGLVSPESSEASADSITNLWKNEDGTLQNAGFGIMAAFLAATLLTRDKYDEKGIDRNVFYQTMGCFNEGVNDAYALTGEWSFEWADWYRRHVAGVLYKLGSLEFEMVYLDRRSAEACG